MRRLSLSLSHTQPLVPSLETGMKKTLSFLAPIGLTLRSVRVRFGSAPARAQRR
jgi:hypothetical protein